MEEVARNIKLGSQTGPFSVSYMSMILSWRTVVASVSEIVGAKNSGNILLVLADPTSVCTSAADVSTGRTVCCCSY